MEFYAPITVGCITNEFPAGHGIFRGHDLFLKPLPHHEELVAGESYHLLPLDDDSKDDNTRVHGKIVRRQGHVRSISSVSSSSTLAAPYRMSLDYQGNLKRSYTEVFSRYNNGRFWKVKLAICPEQLSEILSQEARTQELIESVRTVAKCGNGGVSPMEFSDQWSLSSSRNASSEKEGLVDIN